MIVSMMQATWNWYLRGDTDEPKPQSVLCYKVLYNNSMKPKKLCGHLQTNNSNATDKNDELSHKLITKAFQKKNQFRSEYIKNSNFSVFQTLQSFVSEKDVYKRQIVMC